MFFFFYVLHQHFRQSMAQASDLQIIFLFILSPQENSSSVRIVKTLYKLITRNLHLLPVFIFGYQTGVPNWMQNSLLISVFYISKIYHFIFLVVQYPNSGVFLDYFSFLHPSYPSYQQIILISIFRIHYKPLHFIFSATSIQTLIIFVHNY